MAATLACCCLSNAASFSKNTVGSFLSQLISVLPSNCEWLYVLPCCRNLSAVNYEDMLAYVAGLYTSGFSLKRSLDIRFICGSLKHPDSAQQKLAELHNCTVLADSLSEQDGIAFSEKQVLSVLPPSVDVTHTGRVNTLASQSIFCSRPSFDGKAPAEQVFGQHTGVVLGGTFDRLHNGHKMLLSVACLLASKRLVIGVTNGEMLERKQLYELIQPVDARIVAVRAFLTDVDSTLDISVVPITDPYGPSVTDPDLDCIVCSQETEQGAIRVVEKRHQNGLNRLDVYAIALAPSEVSAAADNWCDSGTTSKISSTHQRKELLGSLLRPPQANEKLPAIPYLIGLTGGIASGKSHIRGYLHSLGAATVNCDKLAHEVYAPGTECYARIVEEFGDVTSRDASSGQSHIDRAKLGAVVFNDAVAREKLNAIVWPAVADLAMKEVKKATSQGHSVVVLEAALLLEAGWRNLVHELWVTFVPKEEAVKRVTCRDDLSEAEALRRIEAQSTNAVRIAQANVVFCSLWDHSETRAQVDKAWKDLQNRIRSVTNTSAGASGLGVAKT